MKPRTRRLKITLFRNRIRLRRGTLRTKRSLSPHRRKGHKVKGATEVLLRALMR